MDHLKLDEIMVTAMEALKLFVEAERKVQPNGEITIVIGNRRGERFEDEAMWRINDAKQALESVPELKNLLEIRVLEMKQADAQKRLSLIRSR